jgi:hypothetical protein
MKVAPVSNLLNSFNAASRIHVISGHRTTYHGDSAQQDGALAMNLFDRRGGFKVIMLPSELSPDAAKGRPSSTPNTT